MQLLNMIVAYVRSRVGADPGDEGATAVEYGLLVALVAVVLIVGVKAFGGYLNGIFSGFVNSLS